MTAERTDPSALMFAGRALCFFGRHALERVDFWDLDDQLVAGRVCSRCKLIGKRELVSVRGAAGTTMPELPPEGTDLRVVYADPPNLAVIRERHIGSLIRRLRDRQRRRLHVLSPAEEER
jgi:hypothetical protein